MFRQTGFLIIEERSKKRIEEHHRTFSRLRSSLFALGKPQQSPKKAPPPVLLSDGLGNEDETTEAGILAKAAEVARYVSTWHGAGRDKPPRTLPRGRRRRQEAARPLVGPPQCSLC